MALAEVFEALAGPDAPVEFRAYDGSQAGAAGSAVKIAVRSLGAAAYLAQAPGGLGLARAYVAGHLDVEGDMYEALARMTKAQSIDMTMAEKLRGRTSGMPLRARLGAAPGAGRLTGTPRAMTATGPRPDPRPSIAPCSRTLEELAR